MQRNTCKLLLQNDYAYSAVGQRTANEITTLNLQNQPVVRTKTYTYDELSRLKTANYGDGQNQTYSFNAMGNRVAKSDNVTGAEGYTFDAANRITTRQVGSAAAQSYTSDANGNTQYLGTPNIFEQKVWDSQNRMTYCATGGKESRFKYGADGLRRRMETSYIADTTEDDSGDFLGSLFEPFGASAHVATFRTSKTARTQGTPTPPVITHYGYDGSNVVREWDENTAGVKTIAATYLLGPSGPMYKRPSVAADVRWYVYDGLGSVVDEVDVNGTMLATKKHDVYGIARAGGTGTAKSKHGFVGGLGHYSDDETGLVYMRARYYDPNIGRFISQDTAGHGSNWFVYCDDDPINKVDSTGNMPDWTTMFCTAGIIAWSNGAWFAYMAADVGKDDPVYNLLRLAGVAAFIIAATSFALASVGLGDREDGIRITLSTGYISLVTLMFDSLADGGKLSKYTAVHVAVTAAALQGITLISMCVAQDAEAMAYQ